MFNDAPFRERMQLSAVNSINWARVMAQVVYYVVATDLLRGPHRRVRAQRQLRQCVLGLDRQADGRADRSAGDRLERQRHPRPVRERQRHEHRTGRAVAQSLDGHPGLVELRAAAVRDERPRRRHDRRAAPSLPCRPAGWRSSPINGGSSSTACSAPAASTTPRRSTSCGAPITTAGMLLDPHSAVGVGAVEQLRVAAGSNGRDPRHRASGEVPRRGRASDGHPSAAATAPGRPVRAQRAGHADCANDLAAVEHSSRRAAR